MSAYGKTRCRVHSNRPGLLTSTTTLTRRRSLLRPAATWIRRKSTRASQASIRIPSSSQRAARTETSSSAAARSTVNTTREARRLRWVDREWSPRQHASPIPTLFRHSTLERSQRTWKTRQWITNRRRLTTNEFPQPSRVAQVNSNKPHAHRRNK